MSHHPRWTCVRCHRHRVPTKGALCYACAQTDPRLPRPLAASAPPGRFCPACNSLVAGDRCPACATKNAG
jgi:hypothetical protein